MNLHIFLNKSWYYTSFLIAFFPLLGIKTASVFIIIFIAISLIAVFHAKKTGLNKKHLKWLLLFTSLYGTYLFSSLFHPLDQSAIFILEKKMGLLVFPLALFLIPFKVSKNHFRLLLLTFAFSSVAVIIYTNTIILIKGIPLNYLQHNDWSYSYRTFFEGIIKIHPTYISIYLGFSTIIFINTIINSSQLWLKIISVIGAFICLIALIPLSAKMPIIALIISLFFFIIFQSKFKKKTKLFFVGFISLVLVSSLTIPALKIRINEVIHSSFTPPKNEHFTSIDVRVGIFKCSSLLIKENYILGVGASEIQNKLNLCYSNYNTNAYDKIDYNTHNEYFNIWLATGIIGLLIFVSLLVLLTLLTFKNNHPLFLSLMILLILCFSTENLLDRQGGVIFFAFFTTLFTKYYFLNFKEKNET